MKTKLSLLLLLCTLFSFSQTSSGDLENYLGTKISEMPGNSGNDFISPSSSQITSWSSCINAIVSDDITTARTNANAVNYQIVLYTDTAISPNKEYYILEEKLPQTNYWGTFIFAKSPTINNLILQAPHSRYDFNTGKEAAYCFVRLNNKALFLNGTHRCNHSSASSCSGTTSACNSTSQAFKISDMAHNATTMWQKTTEILYNSISSAVFVQLHGFTKQTSDPYVILSNGTDVTPTTDYALQIKNGLENADNSLTFKIAHLDDWTRLVGFTNTQGRLINQSANPCNTSAVTTTGRFIHVEQEKSKLRQDSAGWEKMRSALFDVFPNTLSTDNFTLKLKLNSKNPFKNTIDFSADFVKRIAIYNVLGKRVFMDANIEKKTHFSINTSNLISGLYILKVETDIGFIYKKLIRE